MHRKSTDPRRVAIIRTVALLLWVGFIWTHSMENGAESDETSLFFVDWLEPMFAFFGIVGTSLQNHMIRKFAHFTEFFILGALTQASFRAWHRVRRSEEGSGFIATASEPVGVSVGAFVFGAAVAAIDETIQLFVPGRSGMLSDVLLDSSGVLCAVVLCWTVSSLLHSRRQDA